MPRPSQSPGRVRYTTTPARGRRGTAGGLRGADNGVVTRIVGGGFGRQPARSWLGEEGPDRRGDDSGLAAAVGRSGIAGAAVVQAREHYGPAVRQCAGQGVEGGPAVSATG
jgi:hypothetical protein